MQPNTRYQAVRTALMELGPATSAEEVARFVKEQFGMDFDNVKTVALYIAMVKSKMSRKPEAGNNAPSGMFPARNP